MEPDDSKTESPTLEPDLAKIESPTVEPDDCTVINCGNVHLIAAILKTTDSISTFEIVMDSCIACCGVEVVENR